MGIRTAKIINFESVKTSGHGNNSYWSRDASSLNGNTHERRKTLSDWVEVPRSEVLYIVPPLLKLAFRTQRLLWFSALVEEHVLDVLAKDASNFESQHKARVVPARLVSFDASTRYLCMHGQLCLRPFPFCP